MNLAYTLPYHIFKMLAGQWFEVSHSDTDLDVSESQHYFQITTPDDSKYRLLLVEVQANQAVQVKFYEDPTTSSGDALTEINPNRQSSEITSVVAVDEPTIADDGTLLEDVSLGDEGTVRLGYYLIKPDEDYIVKVVPLSDNTVCSCKFGWCVR